MADISSLTENTIVTFPNGNTSGQSKIVFAQAYGDNKALVIVEKTPFHPLSCSWPDQQADTGTLIVDDTTFIVSDSLTAAIDLEDGEELKLLVDTDIPSRHNAPSWRFFVAHIVDNLKEELLMSLVGKDVQLNVDAERRLMLSAAHTATHVVALALNKSAADLWRKDVDLDGLGHPDLDKLAMEKSTITPGKAIDVYRFGKSLRKKYGFEASTFVEGIAQFTEAIKQQVAEWVASGARVVIEADGTELESRRRWTCELDGKLVKFPCGGTHLDHLGQLESIDIAFEIDPEGQGMTMYTSPKLKAE